MVVVLLFALASPRGRVVCACDPRAVVVCLCNDDHAIGFSVTIAILAAKLIRESTLTATLLWPTSALHPQKRCSCVDGTRPPFPHGADSVVDREFMRGHESP